MNKKSITAFHRNLHQWYGRHGRKTLPWRMTGDAYAIYVSEIMLQQTQVSTVLERYYFPFLARFPSLSHLASAEREEILKSWQGLGYYNRAINLHEAAKRCGGSLPQSVEALLELPGIGRNTAHAVAAFAFRQPVAVMEANVKRVLSRIFALTHPADEQLWDKAHQLLDKAQPFDYNQAMMDIGATICTRRAPACLQCSAQTICEGKTAPESYPAPKRKAAPPVRRKAIDVRRNARGEYYATLRATRFLNGLYHFIETDIPPPNVEGICIGHIRQQYSHFTLEADIHLIQTDKAGGKNWHSLVQLHKLPMSMAEKKILALLEAHLSGKD